MNPNAQITDIDLSQISVNLSDYLSDIRPYEGFITCNSPYIGGLLNNVYRKKLSIPDGHTLVRVHGGHVFTLSGGTLYRDGVAVKSGISSSKIVRTAYTDPYVTDSEGVLTVSYAGQTLTVNYTDDISWCYMIDGSTMYLSVVPRFVTDTSWRTSLRSWEISSSGATEKTGTDRFVVISGVKVPYTTLYYATLNYFVSLQCDGAGIITECQYNNKEESFSSITEMDVFSVKHGESAFSTNEFSMIFCDTVKGYWTRGEKLQTPSGFDVLYYGKYISGISYNNSVYTYDVDHLVMCGSDYVIYRDPDGAMWKLTVQAQDIPSFTADEDYIYFYNTDHENTYSFTSGKFFCRSDDYNDRILSRGSSVAMTQGLCATGWRTNAQVENYPNFATQYPEVSSAIPTGDEVFSEFYTGDTIHPVEVFKPNVSGGSAVYQYSLTFNNGTYTKGKNQLLIDTYYPINSDGNTLYNVPLCMEIEDTFSNQKIGVSPDYSYVLALSQLQKVVLGYYELTSSEVKKVFLLQSGYYGIDDRFIYSLSVTDSVMSINGVVANKQDLQFLGAFPSFALFWSSLDKSLYSFSGDNTISKMKEAYRISSVYATYCDPARLTMLIATDIGVIVVYQSQIFLLDDILLDDSDSIYYDGEAYTVGPWSVSLAKMDGYTAQPVKLQTEFYGTGSCQKSVNDCVYLRIADNGQDDGYIKVKSYTLTDRCTESSEQTWTLNGEFFDRITGSRFLQYQAQHQSGSGFSVYVESTHPVISMSIGHTPEAVQQGMKANGGVSAGTSTRIAFN